MPRTTTYNVFANTDAIRPGSDTTYSTVDTSYGHATASLHLGQDAQISTENYPTEIGAYCAFTLIRIDCPTTNSDFSIYITPDTLDAAISLRDALNKAIRATRRITKR